METSKGFSGIFGRYPSRSGTITLGCWMLACSTALGQAPTGKIVGLGATTCTEFMDDVKANSAIQRDYLAWAQGFMSGILLGRPPGVDEGLNLNPSSFGLGKQLEFLTQYCRQHPSDSFSGAVEDLYKSLRREGPT